MTPGDIAVKLPVRVYETDIIIPTYDQQPRSVLPPLFSPDYYLYPYSVFLSTSSRPHLKTYRAVVVENGLLRVTVLPELGGRIKQIEDMQTGGTYLHVNDVVRPVRVPWRWGYLSLGIELNFPIAHSATGTEPVGYELLTSDDGSAGVAVGERECRWGLCWRSEVKLYEGFRGVCVATRCWNPTDTARDVHWWSNAAQPASGDTEFVFPNEPVEVHLLGATPGHWPITEGIDRRWHRNYNEMCGLFWSPTSSDWFGIYHHLRGWGLLHLADPAVMPGKKLWTFGHTGVSADWTLGMTRGGDRACEIQAGFPELQKLLANLEPGQHHDFVEFWIPVDSRTELDDLSRPSFKSVADSLGGVERLSANEVELTSPAYNFWRDLKSAYDYRDEAWLRTNIQAMRHTWPPTGLDLEPALKWAAATKIPEWVYALGVLMCANERWNEARTLLEKALQDDPTFEEAQAILGLLVWRKFNSPSEAWSLLEPVVYSLKDSFLLESANELLRELGDMDGRKRLLEIWPVTDFHRRETEAEIALDSGEPEKAMDVLMREPWERFHCRYKRGELWQAARISLKLPPSPIPDSLGEDPVVVDEGLVILGKSDGPEFTREMGYISTADHSGA